MANWMNKFSVGGRYDTDFSRMVGMNSNGVGILALYAQTPTLSGAIFGDYTKWVRSLTMYPMDVIGDTLNVKKLKIYKEVTNIPCFSMSISEMMSAKLLGSWVYTSKGDFADFEPYTQIQIFLPYYGCVSVKPSDVYNATLYFSLAIDYNSGQGYYYISTGYSWEQSRIIGTYATQLGIQMPLGQTGVNDLARNLALGAVKSGATIAGAYFGGLAGAGAASVATTVATEGMTQTQTRNDVTGRLNIAERTKTATTTTTTKTTSGGNTYKTDVVNTAFDSAGDAITNFQFSPQIDRACYAGVDANGPRRIHVIVKRVKMLPVDDTYKQLYGTPVGKTGTLADYSGYTELASVHLENIPATTQEISMIEQQLLSGVILGLSPKTTINGVNFDLSDYATWQDVIDADAVQPFKLKDYGYVLICESTEDPSVTGALTLNGVNVKSEDTIDDKGDYRTHINVSVNCTQRVVGIPKVIENTPIWGSTWGDLVNIEDSDWIAIDDYVLNKRYLGTSNSNFTANSEPVELNGEWVKITDVVHGGADYTTAALTYRRFTLYTEQVDLFTWAKWSDIDSGTLVFSTTQLDTTGDFVKILRGGGIVFGMNDKNLIADKKFIPSSTRIRDMETTNIEVENAFIFTVNDHFGVALFGWTWENIATPNVSGANIVSVRGHPTEIGRMIMDVNWEQNGPFYYIIEPESGNYVYLTDAVMPYFYLTREI